MLSPGARFGPYEIVSPLGAGGMGEVYRAKDTRLNRSVAVKVLPEHLSKDADARARFEREAQAVAALSHPNILAIHDVGAEDGSAYCVMELLEGETLREKLSGGPLSTRRAVEYAAQIARGLAAAHERGIVHRDLKPENLFVTNDGRVKILDFGLARQSAHAFGKDDTRSPTVQAATQPGAVLGTVGYMSPEQVKGLPVDHRTDIFSFGAVLYETLTGRRAFSKDSAVETMSAILREDPPDVSTSDGKVNPVLDRIVRHCLEKAPEARFQSAGDIAFDLESLSGSSGAGVLAAPAAVPRSPIARRIAFAAAALLVGAAGWVAGRRTAPVPDVSYQRLTFRRGTVRSARFAPDGQTVLYGAAWSGARTEVFSTRVDSTESRPYGLSNADLLGISSSGELALVVDPQQVLYAYWSVAAGVLSRAPLAGGAPHPVLEEVQFADWSPDGKELAAVRFSAGKNRLEYPIGTVLYETGGWLGNPRVSPDGERVAFLDYPAQDSPYGSVAVVDRKGKKTALSSGWVRQLGLAWRPDGKEVWFTATRAGSARALHAVTLSGKERLLLRAPGALTLHDVGKDGAVLLDREELRREQWALPPGATAERDLSWHDYTNTIALSPDGGLVLFHEYGEAGGALHQTYIRKTDGSPAMRLGDGEAFALSPDGRWVLTFLGTTTRQPRMVLLPTGTGTPRQIETEPLSYALGAFVKGGSALLLVANAEGRPLRLWLQDLAGGKPRPIAPEGTITAGLENVFVSPDGNRVVVRDMEGHVLLWPVDGGSGTRVDGVAANELVYGWPDPGTILVGDTREMPLRLSRLDLATGRRTPWRSVGPSDPTGVAWIDSFFTTPDLKSYAYTFIRRLSDLYVVRGLR